MTASAPSAADTQARSDRLFTAAFVRLAIADLAYFTAAGVAIYTLPLYVIGPVGSEKAGAGIAFGAFAITALVLRPFAGRMSDRYGRRPFLLGGAVMCAASMALTAHAESLAAVVALRLMLGVAEAAFFVASLAALADLAPASRMGEAVSYNSLGLYLGLALGPPLGEVLVEGASFTAAWYGAAALAVLAAAFILGLGETRTSAQGAHHHNLIHWKAVPPSLGFFASVIAMGGFLAFASLHSQAVGLSNASIPLFVYGAVVVIGRLAFAKVPDRLPSLPLGAAALLVIALGVGVTASWTTPAGMIAGTALLAIGVTFSTPAFFTAVFATAAPSQRGAASGTASAFLDLGIGGGPILLGLVAQSAGISAAFAVAAGIALAGSAWTMSLGRFVSRHRTAALS